MSVTYRITEIQGIVPNNQLCTDIINEINNNGYYEFVRQLPIPDNLDLVTVPTPTSAVSVPIGNITGPISSSEELRTESEISNTSENTISTEPIIKWSEPRRKRVHFLNDYLTTQVRVRYAMFNRPTNGLSNVIIDSFIPRLLVANNMQVNQAIDTSNLPATALSISPWFANMFNTKQLQISQMIRILGYDEKTIKRLLVSVKKQKWSISFIGFGGTNVNTAHWITALSELVHVVKPFYYAEVYENDKVDVSNLLRFPLDPSTFLSHSYGNKIELAIPYLNKLSATKPGHMARYFIPGEYMYGARNFIDKNYLYEENDNSPYYRRKHIKDENGHNVYTLKHNNARHIFYGAPNIETREKLSKIGYFISATHASTDCSLHLNPEQDSQLQVESYGMIQLSQFFMNQLRMAIGLLETLADPNFNPEESNKVLLNYSFDGKSKKPCDRSYNFQMDFDGRMLDEADAANIGGN